MSPSPEDCPLVYLLSLTDAGAPDVNGPYICLPAPATPYTLRFAIEGTSSICRDGSLWINIPEGQGEFERESFREIKLNPTFGRILHIDIPITTPGTFCYYITYTPLPEFSPNTDIPKPKPTRTRAYYIAVSPTLAINGEKLPLGSIAMHSILSKFLGPVDKWDSHMKYIAEKGYNMIHFTPLMERGASNSPFSLYNQLNFDPIAFPNGENDIIDMVKRMEKNHGLLSLTDVVWNHTAHNSEWLQHHPEAGYNRVTAPWLESAYQLDTALLEFSNSLESLGFPTTIESKEDLLKIMEGVKTHVIKKTKLWEFYVIDVEETLKATMEKWASKESVADYEEKIRSLGFDKDARISEQAEIIRKIGIKGLDRLGERYRRSLDPALGSAYLNCYFGLQCTGDDDSNKTAREKIKALLDELNLPFYKEYDTDIAEALEQMYNRIDYTRLADHGPKQGLVTKECPLLESYFTRLPVNDVTKQHDPKSLALANNGWLWDNTGNFASARHKSYLRREVISWGDCVKLRYGEKPEDSPFLWDFMARYTTLMARIFHGFRIDNCHSTPLHVGEYMLDVARRERKDLYTVAELFTGDENKDIIFLQRLGLNSLVREALVAWGPGELSRLVHRHGGKPIGSFEQEFITRGADDDSSMEARELVKAVTAAPIHALFMDCTHDNEVPTQKRTPQDTLPNGALSAMCDCGIGSVMGYDEIYPHLIDLVHESRNYDVPPKMIDDSSAGIAKAKVLLNRIHVQMGKEGYSEMHVHHENEYITMHRVHPKSHRGYFLIAHTAFGPGDHRGDFSPVSIPKTKAKLMATWKLEADGSAETIKKVREDKTTLRGLPANLQELGPPKIEESEDGTTTITIPDYFPPGSIALFETWVEGFSGNDLDVYLTSGVEDSMCTANLAELNMLLYRCDAEERDVSEGREGVYDIPGHGPLVYAGLQGWWSVVRNIIRNNELAHPLCQHLREGRWALGFTASRVERLSEQYPGLKGPAKWLRERLDRVDKVPSFLVPRYFALVVQAAYTGAVERAVTLLSENIRAGTGFVRHLSLVSLQVTGITNSGSLWPHKKVPSMGAGLPHFAVEWARCWGRDVFISLRGLYLATGRYDDAKEHILAFASVLKHGLIPNLLGSGNNPRYNARDAVWFFLQAVQDYTELVPNGIDILQEKVKRRFLPYDDAFFPVDDPRAYSKESTIEEVIQEAMQKHAEGIKFREANAGPGLDSQMKDEGFNLEVNPDWETGFIFGGNQFNCGTWMDKMGESELAGNKGIPGTPRDGAAIEIIGLLYSTLRWLSKLNNAGKYSRSCVKRSNGHEISFTAWADLIKANFERCFYVPISPDDDHQYAVNTPIVNRRGIYKDLFRSGKEYEDYQLRPNYAIAMTVSPDLFTREHALTAIANADKILRGPLGIATLDPSDMNYRPYYINSLDNDDFATSKGRNYHQGPEWLWPLGYFLRAMLQFSGPQSLQHVASRMEKCRDEIIVKSPWAGLTELTNKNGEFCGDSSPTQAWSASCLLDVFFDAQRMVQGAKP